MPKWKRSNIVYLALSDESGFRLSALLQGRLEKEVRGQFFGMDLLKSKRHALTREQVDLLLALPADRWIESQDIEARFQLDPLALKQLIEAGWLLTQGQTEEEQRARELDESLASYLWHSDALFFHRMSRHVAAGEGEPFRELDVRRAATHSAEFAQDFLDRYGKPPDACLHLEGTSESIGLPDAEDNGELVDLLRRRRTVRAFDQERPMSQRQLSQLLKFTFGQLGKLELVRGLELVKKGSPSGGALHPIEGFPLLIHVDGMEPGLYHYEVDRHRLKPISILPSVGEARDLARQIGAGQLYFGEAHAMVLMVARFHRNHWKYRQQTRTYNVILMDAGHLSQTFYLMATQMGLGAFFSAAIDLKLSEDILGLPPEAFGPLGVCGCGLISQEEDVPNHGSLRFKGR